MPHLPLCTLTLALLVAPALAAQAARADDAADVDALRAALERDQATLIELISQPPGQRQQGPEGQDEDRGGDGKEKQEGTTKGMTKGMEALADDPALRAIAERMPRTQEALRQLEAGPAQPTTPAAPMAPTPPREPTAPSDGAAPPTPPVQPPTTAPVAPGTAAPARPAPPDTPR